jgi:ribosomal protein L37E
MIAARPGRDIDRDSPLLQEDVVCGVCGYGRMIVAREPRSPVLRVVGFTLWADALLTLILGMGSGALFVTGTGNPTDEAIQRHRGDAVAAMVHVASIPRDAIDRFEQTGTFDDAVLAQLSASERSRTDRILEVYRRAVEADIASGARFAIGIPVACLLLFVAGLILTLKRDVARCATCGHVKHLVRRRSTWLPSVMNARTD